MFEKLPPDAPNRLKWTLLLWLAWLLLFWGAKPPADATEKQKQRLHEWRVAGVGWLAIALAGIGFFFGSAPEMTRIATAGIIIVFAFLIIYYRKILRVFDTKQELFFGKIFRKVIRKIFNIPDDDSDEEQQPRDR